MYYPSRFHPRQPPAPLRSRSAPRLCIGGRRKVRSPTRPRCGRSTGEWLPTSPGLTLGKGLLHLFLFLADDFNFLLDFRPPLLVVGRVCHFLNLLGKLGNPLSYRLTDEGVFFLAMMRSNSTSSRPAPASSLARLGDLPPCRPSSFRNKVRCNPRSYRRSSIPLRLSQTIITSASPTL